MENSNNIQKKGYLICKDYDPVQASSVQVDKLLLPEIMKLIFSFLNFKDYESTVLVNHYWKDLTVQTAVYRTNGELRVFLTFLSQNLKEEPGISQIEISYSECNSSQNLIQIKSFLEKSKKEIIEVLKGLKETDLKRLKKAHIGANKPELFEDIFDLTGIYKELDEATAKSTSMEKIIKLVKVAKKFVCVGYCEKSFEIANMIQHNYGKTLALVVIAEELAKKGQYEKALKIVDGLESEYDKRSALCGICKGLAEFGNFKKSLEILEKIEECNEKNDVLAVFADKLAETEQFKVLYTELTSRIGF